MAVTKKALKWALIFGIIAVIVTLYLVFDPAYNKYFPKCPFKLLTGLDCPGCGSQRTVHALFNLDLGRAMKENALLVIAIPYLITGFVFDIRKPKSEKAYVWRKRLFGPKAIYIVFAIVVIYWIVRNIKYF